MSSKCGARSIIGARWSPDGAETILRHRAVIVNGDLDDYINYYKNRYNEDTIDRSTSPHDRNNPQ